MSRDLQEGLGLGIVFALLIAVMTSEAPKEIDYEVEDTTRDHHLQQGGI